MVIKMLLQKITLSTVNWINSGFDGKPSFIQDPGKFFGDIAKNEILQFGLEINNPELFPFGKAWLQNQAIHFNNKFADNARYSLDEMIRNTTPQFSAQAFQLNFSHGGWGAWSAMTQYPQNNPLGFQLMASDELQRRLEGTSQSTARNVREALEAADGFLGDQRCINAETGQVSFSITKAEENAALRETPPRYLCSSWEYVTPGKLVAEWATSTINYPENNLLKADDLNDAVAAILDALLSRFSTDMMAKGYAYFNDEGVDGTFVYNPDALREDYTSWTEKDFAPVHLTSSWLSANPNFNIRADLTQALIDEQRTYADKLNLQNKELNSTTDGKDYKMGDSGISNAYGLIPAITQLDYCIPGPHPGWEEDSRRVLDAVTNVIIPETEQSLANRDKDDIIKTVQLVAPLAGVASGTAIGAAIGTAAFPIVGTVIGAALGAFTGWAVSRIFGDDNAEKVRIYYAGIIQIFTGLETYWEEDNGKMVQALSSKQGAVQALNIMLERYIDIMHLAYSPKVLPSIYKEAATEFYKLKGYTQIIANNEEAVSVTKNVVNALGEIKNDIDALNAEFPDGGDEYENKLKVQINAFGRLSSSMVNGDDIANADNLLKQIIDEKIYVYKDLLKGPLGCEKDLEEAKEGKLGLSDQLHATKRMDYPFPILYTYNVPAGGVISDPFPLISNLTVPNKTNMKAIYPASYGPGFLSYYSFQKDGRYRTNCVANENGAVPWCELHLEDVVPMDNNELRNLGTIGAPNRNPGGPFEHTIGVY